MIYIYIYIVGDEINIELSYAIQQARAKKKWSQADLSKVILVHKEAYFYICLHIYMFTIYTIYIYIYIGSK